LLSLYRNFSNVKGIKASETKYACQRAPSERVGVETLAHGTSHADFIRRSKQEVKFYNRALMILIFTQIKYLGRYKASK
jgi:hypothetical protein